MRRKGIDILPVKVGDKALLSFRNEIVSKEVTVCSTCFIFFCNPA